MIEITHLSHTYGDKTILDDINLNISDGAFTAILGRNGSGKSTLAKHLNAILIPKRGHVTVDGMDTADESLIYDIREKVGMVFQNPESQAVASVVEDDTAFAPENLGLSEEETEARVEFALNAVGLTSHRKKAISTLSGGQKQLTAIAGILAMRPKYMVFDEGTSMLDPAARKRVLDCVIHLKNELNIAVIWITHYMDEAALADRVIILDNGKIAADGAPKDVFSDSKLIEGAGLDLPESARLCLMLINGGVRIPKTCLTPTDLADTLAKLLKSERKGV
jgi:energy-coupling factor transport system ATP-binding protein